MHQYLLHFLHKSQVFLSVCGLLHSGVGEREREREREGEGGREGGRERGREGEREGERQTETETETDNKVRYHLVEGTNND
jgi:hypothetical protein